MLFSILLYTHFLKIRLKTVFIENRGLVLNFWPQLCIYGCKKASKDRKFYCTKSKKKFNKLSSQFYKKVLQT